MNLITIKSYFFDYILAQITSSFSILFFSVLILNILAFFILYVCYKNKLVIKDKILSKFLNNNILSILGSTLFDAYKVYLILNKINIDNKNKKNKFYLLFENNILEKLTINTILFKVENFFIGKIYFKFK